MNKAFLYTEFTYMYTCTFICAYAQYVRIHIRYISEEQFILNKTAKA